MIYKDIVKLYKKLVKNDYWSFFTVKNLFSFKSDEGHNSVMVFVDNELAKCHGMQLFYTPNGLNFLHDALTIKNPISGLLLDVEMLASSLLPSSALTDEDKSYIREHGCNVKKENNLIIYSYKAGYSRHLCTEEELTIFLDHLCFMDSLLDQRFTAVLENFEKEQINLAYFYITERTFILIDSPQVELESFPRMSPAYKPFSLEYKDYTPVDDEGYMIVAPLPIFIDKNGETPLILIFNYPNSNQLYFDYILANSKNAKRNVYIPLDNAFSKIGIPLELVTNNRIIYSSIYKTLDLAGIKVKYSNEIPHFSNIKDFADVIKYLDSTIDAVTDGIFFYNKKTANVILTELCEQLNEYKYEELFDSPDEYEYNEINNTNTDDSNEIS